MNIHPITNMTKTTNTMKKTYNKDTNHDRLRSTHTQSVVIA